MIRRFPSASIGVHLRFHPSEFRVFAFSNSRSGTPGGVHSARGQPCSVRGMERENGVAGVSEVSAGVARCLPGGVALPEGLPGEPVSLPAARAYCRALARSHYENFMVASALLPRELRQPMFHVYAYCRWADDLADEAGSTQLGLAG